MTSSRQRLPEPQDRSPYPENLRAIIYKYGLQGESAHWVNEHWDDGRYFPTIERQRPNNFDRTLRRWLIGEGNAQEEIDEVLYTASWKRHGVARAITKQMHDAARELPRFVPSTLFEERVELWQTNWSKIESFHLRGTSN